MKRTTQAAAGLLLAWSAILGLAWLGSTACAKEEVVDLDVAKADPDFAVQGEYLGEGKLPDGTQGKLGAQVIARGDGRFDVYLLSGGLPGEGWKKGDPRVRIEGQRDGDVVKLTGPDVEGQIAQGTMTLAGKAKIELRRVERKSPTLGAKPPAGAVVLFAQADDVANFDHGTLGPEEALMAGVTTKQAFDSYRLHLEFRLSWMPHATGQGRSNSGVYVHDAYEIQVLDSFGLEGQNNECGGLYSIKEPDVNMCLPPMVWQTFDIDFTAPKYEGGQKVANARLTVRHNGVVIHDNVELPRGTPGRQPEGPGPRPIHLQGHGCKVQYRNIWLEPKQ